MSNKRKTRRERGKQRAVGVLFPDPSLPVHLINTKTKRWERDAATIEHAFDHVAHCDTHVHTYEGLAHDDLVGASMMLVEYDPATVDESDSRVFGDVVVYLAEFGITVDDSIEVINPDDEPVRKVIWAAWNDLPEDEPSRVKRIAHDLGLSHRVVADVVYPEPTFGWDEDDEPDLPEEES